MEWGTIWVIMHIIAIVLAMSAVTISDIAVTLALTDSKHGPPSYKILRICSLGIWIGLLLMVPSGIGLFLDRPGEFMQSGKFLAKMVIVLTLVINGVFLHRTVLPKILGLDHQDWLWRNEKFSRVMNLAIPAGVVSLVSWWGALLLGAAGRQPWTLTQVLSIYFGIIVLGITIGFLVVDVTIAKKSHVFVWQGKLRHRLHLSP